MHKNYINNFYAIFTNSACDERMETKIAKIHQVNCEKMRLHTILCDFMCLFEKNENSQKLFFSNKKACFYF